MLSKTKLLNFFLSPNHDHLHPTNSLFNSAYSPCLFCPQSFMLSMMSMWSTMSTMSTKSTLSILKCLLGTSSKQKLLAYSPCYSVNNDSCCHYVHVVHNVYHVYNAHQVHHVHMEVSSSKTKFQKSSAGFICRQNS